MSVTNVVFDIGGVLVDWKPELAWAHTMGSEEAARGFMARVDFSEKNLRADGGETFADLSNELDDPEDAAHLRAYVPNFGRTITGLLQGTWDILHRLKSNGLRVHAITNWSAETWSVGVATHPALGEVFEVLVVSGEENIIKPDPRIFDLLCTRAGVDAENCIFIDDSPKNVEGARAFGMDAVHFTGPAALLDALTKKGLL